MNIPLLDLTNQYKQLKEEIDQAVLNVLESGNYIMGPQVAEFEKNIANYLGIKHAIGVASGSDALLLSLHALEIGPGDKVIVPTFTFFSTAGAVSRLGATPVFVDIDSDTYNIDITQTEKCLQEEEAVKCIIPVHLFGLPVDMQALMKLAEEYNVFVVEDACQAIDADTNYDNKKAGTVGHTGCFSFFPTKNLGCFGDGGLIVTNDDKLAERIRVLRVHGASPKYYHSMIGYNSRLDTIQAAVLNVKLKYLNKYTEKRQQIAALYDKEFKAADLNRKIKWLSLIEGHVYHQYVIEAEDRDELQKSLNYDRINTAVYYPGPLHLQDCFSTLGYKKGGLPVAEQLCTRVLALPIDPELREEQIFYVVERIKHYYS